MQTNANASLAHQSSPQDRRPSTFAIPPEQHLHFPRNLDAVSETRIPPTQVPPSRINDFISSAGSSSHNMNGWELPANETTVGGTWDRSHQLSSVPSNHQQPAFQAKIAQPLSNNPFHHQTEDHHDTTTSSHPTNTNFVSDDSLMVDNLFASLGTSDSDGAGLLNAMHSVSLEGRAGAQQSGNWESTIFGLAGETDSSSFLRDSRLGDYREES